MEKKFAAVIFDFDGTVIDNEGNWEAAFQQVITNNKVQTSIQFKQPNGWMHEPGAGLTVNWKRYVESKEDVAKYTDETVREYLKESKDFDTIMVRDGIAEMVELIKEKGMPTALCTGNAWYMVEQELEKLQLYLAFDTTTTGDEVLMGKPDPEIYNLTLQKLGVEADECLVIEDAIVGIRAAVEAGCAVAGLISDYASRETILAAGAKWAIESVFEIQELL